VVWHRAGVVRATAHLRCQPARHFAYPPAATHLRAASTAPPTPGAAGACDCRRQWQL